MLSRIFSEYYVYKFSQSIDYPISNKDSHKTFTESHSASLLRSTENILDDLSGGYRDFLTMVALSCTKSKGICTIFIHLYLLCNIIFVRSIKDDTDTCLSFSSRTNHWCSKRLRLLDN